MTRLLRDARAFAARVKMGSKRLWLLVEGQSIDRTFYDRVLSMNRNCQSAGYSIRLVEQIDLEGSSGGGKSHAYGLHDFLEMNDLLTQRSRDGLRTIAFALDRDLEDLTGSLRGSTHVLYTRLMDVESDVLFNGDMPRAACSAYSLTRESVETVVPDSQSIFSDLALLWREWITLGVCACSCGVNSDIPHSRHSKVNETPFGPLIPSLAREYEKALVEKLDEAGRARLAETRKTVEAVYDRGESYMLLKGRWIAAYVCHLIISGLGDEPRKRNVAAETLTKTCLETLPPTGAWAEHYGFQLDALLAS